MKSINKGCILLSLIVLILFPHGSVLSKEDSRRDTILRAMQDEMKRNMSLLKIENMERPFFISYNMYDAQSMEVIATLGSVVKSEENRYRNHNVRVMVGDYSTTDENFQGTSRSYSSSLLQGSDRLPLEDDYFGIRSALWIVTDNTYKLAAELFEHKKAALGQQTRAPEDVQLNDFSRAPVVRYNEPPRTINFERKKWEKVAEDISGYFRMYPDIYSSQVRIFFYQGDMFFTNSEGTEIVQPLTLSSIQINAYTQAVDGEPLSNHLVYYGIVPEDLPDSDSIIRSVKSMTEELLALRTAAVFDESYFGPVMLEDQAVAEFFTQRLFGGNNGLIAYRKPVISRSGGVVYGSSDEETLDDRIDRRILSSDFTVKAIPGLERFMGQRLIGCCHVDAEGVQPPEEIVLVENGILKTLLNNRTPTPKVRESNGHQRPVIGSGGWTSNALGPGVISISTSNGTSAVELKKELLKRARDEGLEYGILIRKLKPTFTGAQYSDPMVQMTMSFGGRDGATLTEPVLVYRVYVEDGREELVRSVKLGGVSLSTLRHLVGASEKQFVYNNLVTSNYSSGIPASLIVPYSLILEELEVKNEKRDYTPKLPVVSSPLSQK